MCTDIDFDVRAPYHLNQQILLQDTNEISMTPEDDHPCKVAFIFAFNPGTIYAFLKEEDNTRARLLSNCSKHRRLYLTDYHATK